MPVIRAILFSFSFHILLILAAVFVVPLLATPPAETPIEVSIISPTPTNSKKVREQTVVRQALVPDRMKVPEDETLARFLSEQKQRVKQETQAEKNGMTENRSNLSTSSKEKKLQTKKPQEKKITRKDESPDKDGYRNVDISKDLQDLNRLNDGASTVGQALPNDVRIGSFTALNTDRYLFYTFYARIEESIRFRWESRVEQAIRNLGPAAMVNFGNKDWTTVVEFLLDSDGNVKKALIMKESGVVPFDASAVRAFQEAAVFPNPPQEMIQEDGFIHLKFAFTVNFRPPTLVNSN
jgi:TonB family protein